MYKEIQEIHTLLLSQLTHIKGISNSLHNLATKGKLTPEEQSTLSTQVIDITNDVEKIYDKTMGLIK